MDAVYVSDAFVTLYLHVFLRSLVSHGFIDYLLNQLLLDGQRSPVASFTSINNFSRHTLLIFYVLLVGMLFLICVFSENAHYNILSMFSKIF